MTDSGDVLISLGSNIDPKRHLVAATRLLAERFPLTAASPVYESAPVGRTDQPVFANAAVRLQEVALSPAALKEALREIEDALGRVRDPTDKSGPRTVDLDLSLFGDLVSDDPPLPDPSLSRHWFVAIPLADVAPEMIVPGDGRTLAAIAESLRDQVDGHPLPWGLLNG